MRRTRLRAGRRSKRSGSRAWAPCASRCISLARYLTSSASSSGVCLGGCGPNIHITPITLDFTPSLGDMPGMIARRSVLANVVQQRLWTRGDEAEYHARQRGVWLQVAASEGGRAVDRRLHFWLQFEAGSTRPGKIGQGRGPGVICDRPLGATLGATRLNELVVLRTDVNSGQRPTQGSGLI